MQKISRKPLMKLPKSTFVVAGLRAGCLLTIALLVVFLFGGNWLDNHNPAKQHEMLNIALIWGRLSPFPQNATNLTVQTEGNLFTRSFRASFSAPKQDIKTWLANSPGTRETTPQTMPDGRLKYVIAPGGGANIAEVTVDFETNTIEIYVSWS
jgi:hypothetical protein